MGQIEPPELLRRHAVSVADYYRMAEVGLLAPDARVELIEGEVIDMAPIGTRHASTVMRLTAMASAHLATKAIVSVQMPLRLSERSEPQPDLALLRPRDDFYAGAHPTAADVLLLIEVSDTTARYDREIKAALYARHGVPEVWIVDLDNRRLRLLRQPKDGDYTEVVETAAPGVVQPALLPGVSFDLSWLFT